MQKNKSDIVLIKAKSEYEHLQEEIRILRARIIALTTERDDLVCRECKELAAKYNSEIGVLELQVVDMQLKVHQLKFMIELLQANINRQEEINEEEVRHEAHERFIEFENDLNQKAEESQRQTKFFDDEEEKEREWQREQEEKRQRRSEENSEEDEDADDSDEESDIGDSGNKYKSRSDEIKALYRKIVKALHPDANPNQPKEEKEMYLEAVTAYNEGDLDKLRKIAAMIDSGSFDESGNIINDEENLESLREIIEYLKAGIESLENEIYNIKNSFPYTMKEFLSDEKAVADRKLELLNILKETSEIVVELENRMDEMLREHAS